jgi:hypothetical protein
VRRGLAVVLALAFTGCGQTSPDLFEVQRSGSDPNANVDLVVNDGGTVECNKGKSLALPGTELLDARELARQLEKLGALSIELPPAPNSILRYRVRTESGTVAFSDTSASKPKTFDQVIAFSKDVIENTCKINR